ncbi:nuclear transport factor 2 family protein [Trebonia kvetii]|uniref:Nuclear transport factor 2 family protein n=1 Tax=Trebonia kvetii TaxID=2480626 RepID=A0A6P2BUU5_9ACTN|nr:nuclear transport factor 2 family protein [Trebonia kvetii]TVZ02121.1 nuclear transport factor 2 family protein [Trebonia kvetii]
MSFQSSEHDELAQLRARLRELEDRAAITQLVAEYGPAVDSGDAAAAAALWTDDGCYETDPSPLIGARAIADMVDGPLHQAIIGGGAGHILGPVAVTVSGDTAVAVGYSLLVRYSAEDGAFSVFRCSANRWELARADEGWKVVSRRNALLDGNPSARNLLRTGRPA